MTEVADRDRTGRPGGRLAWAAVAIAIAVSTWHFGASAWRAQSRGIVDFPIFVQHAHDYLETGDLYPNPDDPRMYEPSAAVYKFPPLYALALLPWVAGGIPSWIFLAHWALLIAVYLAATVLLIRTLMPERGAHRTFFVVAALVVALNLEPFFETLWRQQAEVAILLLFAVGVRAIRRGADHVAGGALAAATLLKIYPVPLFGFFLIRRRWQGFLGGAVVGVLMTAATVIVFGLETHRVYFLEVLPRMLAEPPLIRDENVSLARWGQVFGLAPMAAKAVGQAVGVVLLGATLWAMRRARDPLDETLVFASLIPLALLVMPNAWVAYQMLLLVPMLAVLAAALRGARADLPLVGGVALATFLMLFYWPCASPEVAWPCAETPHFLGLVRLPRGLHDGMVEARTLATIVVQGVTIAAIGRGTGPRANLDG